MFTQCDYVEFVQLPWIFYVRLYRYMYGTWFVLYKRLSICVQHVPFLLVAIIKYFHVYMHSYVENQCYCGIRVHKLSVHDS